MVLKFIIKGKGDIVINFGFCDCTLKNVLYFRSLRHNLVSGPMLDQHKLSFVGKNGCVKTYYNNNCILKLFCNMVSIMYIQI